MQHIDEVLDLLRLDDLGHDTFSGRHPDTILQRTFGGQVMAQALAALGPVTIARRTVHPYAFAVPAGVMRQAGRNCGATEIMSPWGDAVCEADV